MRNIFPYANTNWESSGIDICKNGAFIIPLLEMRRAL